MNSGLHFVAVAGGALLLCAGCGGPVTDGVVDYNWDVRPILSDNCYRCHGPDDGAREAGLRLDIRDEVVAATPGSPGRGVIEPGDPSLSELIRRVSSDDPDYRMPPPHTHRTLSNAEIETLTRWIEQGAEYKRHWSFIPPADHVPPASRYSADSVNAIDDFIFAEIEKQGLVPAREADRETLISRVTFTLTGLPPTPDEVDAFVADADDDAYERLVDRLLAQPAYGERMATEWLDAARFADSDGYLDDEYQRLLHPWRDWVIEAFNSNMRYDRFGTVQLAGDLVENASKDDLIASGFGRLHRNSAENGIIDEEYRVEYVIDRTDTLGTAFLGLSVGCARCHDHKFDPISHADYYSLTAFFQQYGRRRILSTGEVGNRSYGVSHGRGYRSADPPNSKRRSPNSKLPTTLNLPARPNGWRRSRVLLAPRTLATEPPPGRTSLLPIRGSPQMPRTRATRVPARRTRRRHSTTPITR